MKKKNWICWSNSWMEYYLFTRQGTVSFFYFVCFITVCLCLYVLGLSLPYQAAPQVYPSYFMPSTIPPSLTPNISLWMLKKFPAPEKNTMIICEVFCHSQKGQPLPLSPVGSGVPVPFAKVAHMCLLQRCPVSFARHVTHSLSRTVCPSYVFAKKLLDVSGLSALQRERKKFKFLTTLWQLERSIHLHTHPSNWNQGDKVDIHSLKCL